MPKDHGKRALLLTVGTGDVTKLEETLFIPLRKSISDGQFNQVILLPSQFTKDFADSVSQDLQDLRVTAEPLPTGHLENDADACYAHYSVVIDKLRANGFKRHEIMVDFTRGTKAMSAALVLAAVRHGLPRLRYIVGQRDERGMVKPGSEDIRDTSTTVVTGHLRLDAARRFFERGNFAAALDALPDPAHQLAKLYPSDVLEWSAYLRPLAQFYAEWDRLDYKAAASIKLGAPPSASSDWDHFKITDEMRQWVSELAKDLPESSQDKAQRLRRLAADLLANGERRIRDRQFEDAIIRAYRVLELVGQLRLFEKNLDSEKLPSDHPAVKKVDEETKRKGRNGLSKGPNNCLTAGRENVARILRCLEDPLADELFKLGDRPSIRASDRNLSVLIHGFKAVSPADEDKLKELYKRLDALLFKDGGEAAGQRLALARSLNFSRQA
ncbi:MAG: TIGR02710 family CRISPR-associated CARF protein [Thermodesulfobacteriota bacterium]